MTRALACLLLAALPAAAQTYPAKPIRLIVPSAPGGPSDIIARAVGQTFAENVRQTVIIDNRPGAWASLGSALAAAAPPDGYTLLIIALTNYTINASLYARLPFDPLTALAPATILAGAPYVMVVHPSLPVRTVGELVALAKRRPGELNYSSGGAGTGPHLATELFKVNAGVDLVHIPYKGAGPALNDLVAGHVQLQLANMLAGIPFVRSGQLRVIAVSGRRRAPLLPDVPTLAESGVAGFEEVGGHAIWVPGATPRAIQSRLHQEFLRVLEHPDVRARLASEGAEIFGTPPDEAAALMRSDIRKWGEVVKRLNLRVN